MRELLVDAFRDYYRSTWVRAPPDIEKREFGVGWESKIDTRYKVFSTENELNKFLRKETPLYISYSVAKYKEPPQKGVNPDMESTDLVFEFDVDELHIPSENDVWICENCFTGGKGYRKKCPKCGSPVKMVLFPDERREEVLKERVSILVNDFIKGDLGFKEVSVNFSGNRGYHIHVYTHEVYTKEERTEITEYVFGHLLNPSLWFWEGTTYRGIPARRIPKPTDRGWGGRIARAIIRLIENSEREFVQKNKTLYISMVKEGYFPQLLGIKVEDIVRELEKEKVYMGAPIDIQTSADVRRLIRLPGSLHGGTGLVAKPVDNIESFDPYRDAVVLSKRVYIRVHVAAAPSFTLRGETFGPYKDEEVELPLYAGVYLIGKGVARWALHSSV